MCSVDAKLRVVGIGVWRSWKTRRWTGVGSARVGTTGPKMFSSNACLFVVCGGLVVDVGELRVAVRVTGALKGFRVRLQAETIFVQQ